VRLLLDTHTFIWFIEGNPRLSAAARAAIEQPDAQRFVSIATAWELAIKMSLGRLDLSGTFAEIIPSQVENNAMIMLPITVNHLTRLTTLPLHHRDPFDRMLVAQALEEQLAIVGADAAFDAYALERLW
jgi:PIN domain nuclease of toxin-antitoxin system